MMGANQHSSAPLRDVGQDNIEDPAAVHDEGAMRLLAGLPGEDLRVVAKRVGQYHVIKGPARAILKLAPQPGLIRLRWRRHWVGDDCLDASVRDHTNSVFVVLVANA